MNERPTPETDDVAWLSNLLQYETVDANFARRLERERDDLLDRLTALEHSMPVELANLERERDEARDTIVDVLSALKPMHNEGPRLAALRVKEERDEAREAAEKAKAYKRVLKDDNAKLRRKLATERALADRLADSLTACERWVNQQCDVKTEANKALMEWKEARK